MAIPSVSPLTPQATPPVQPPAADPALQDAARAVLAVADTQGSDLGGDVAKEARGEPSDNEPAVPLDRAIEALNETLEAWSTRLRFEMDPDAQRLVVTVLDSQTGDTIRTIPSDAVLRMAKMIVSMQGTQVDTQA